MSHVTSQHQDGECQLVLDSLPLIAHGHWKDPERLPESTCQRIEAHRATCASCATQLKAAIAEGETAVAFDQLMRERARRRLRPEPSQREEFATFARSQPMATETDQACDELVGTRMRERVGLSNERRHMLLAMIEAHTPSETTSEDIAATPATSAVGRVKAGRLHRISRFNPRWVVPVAGAAAVMLLMMAGIDSQTTMAEDAITSTENLPLRWQIEVLDGYGYDEKLYEVLSAIQAEPKSAFFELLPDAVDTEMGLYVRGVTNRLRLGGRDAVTIEYRCDKEDLRCVLHATRLAEGESLPEALGVSVQPVEMRASETAKEMCQFWMFTVNGTSALAWHDRSRQVSYVLVAPSVPKDKLKRFARCLRYPSRHVGLTATTTTE